MSDYGIGKIIVIAVEHGEKERLIEYNVGKTLLGQGNGKQYIRFITDTLKPFVDKPSAPIRIGSTPVSEAARWVDWSASFPG